MNFFAFERKSKEKKNTKKRNHFLYHDVLQLYAYFFIQAMSGNKNAKLVILVLSHMLIIASQKSHFGKLVAYNKNKCNIFDLFVRDSVLTNLLQSLYPDLV